MPTIERIEITHHQLPLDPPYAAAWDPQPRRAFPVAVYRVFDSDGRMGVSAGDACRGLADYLELFVGQPVTALERHAAVLANIDFFDGRPWPLEIALWDLVGQLRGQPVWRLVGGRGDSVRPYASSGSHWPLAEVDDRIARLLEEGFGALKLRLGRPSLDDDLAVLERVRDAAGTRLELMVDCNQGWRMPWDTRPAWGHDAALAVGRRLDELGVYWMEEPLHRADVAGHVALREELTTRIAGGEMTRDPSLLDRLLELRAFDVFQPDAAVTLGFSRMVEFARRVDHAELTFSPHTWGCGPVLVANAHLVAGTTGTPWLEFPYDPPGWTLDRRDFVLTRAVAPRDDGRIHLGTAPGFGLVLDEERLAATRTDRASYH